MDIKRTEDAIAVGLASNPTNLELLTLKAAARFLDDDPRGFEAQKQQVFAQNAEFSQFYGIVGGKTADRHNWFTPVPVRAKDNSKQLSVPE